MRIALRLALACLLADLSLAAFANGGGGMSMPSMPLPRQETPQQKARNAYNDGLVRYREALASLQTLTGTL